MDGPPKKFDHQQRLPQLSSHQFFIIIIFVQLAYHAIKAQEAKQLIQ